MTHGHADHTGAVPQLLAAYPEVKVVAHVDELKYLIGEPPANYFGGLDRPLLRRIIKAAA